LYLANPSILVAEDGYLKMSGQDQEISVEQEEVLPEETLGNLKRAKAAAKTAFTKVRR